MAGRYDTDDLEREVDELHEINARLREENERLSRMQKVTGSSDTIERMHRAEREAADLREENRRLASDSHHKTDQVEQLTDQVNRIEREFREIREQRDHALDELQQAKLSLERAESELDRERRKAIDAAVRGENVREARDKVSVELLHLTTERDGLLEELRNREADLEAYQEAVSELKGDLEDAHEDKAALATELQQLRLRLKDIQGEASDATAGVSAAQAQLESRDEEIKQLNEQLKQAAVRAAADQRVLLEAKSTAEKAVTAMQAEVRAIKEQTRVRDLEAEVASLRDQCAELQRDNEELSSLVADSNAALNDLQEDIRALERGRDAAIEDALRMERQRIKDAAVQVADAGDAIRAERKRYEELLLQKGEVERSLADAHARLARYEKQYSLQDAVKEMEVLRQAIALRDADIARLTDTAGKQLDQLDILTEIARRLASRAGLSRDIDLYRQYPEMELRAYIQTALERLKSVNTELQQQNDALEEQRLKLLRQLRVHAEQLGDTSLRYFGLTAEQLMVVNEFAENLRNGKVELPVTDRTRELQTEARQLRNKIEDLTEQLALARTHAGAGGGGNRLTDAANAGTGAAARPATAPTARDTSSAVEAEVARQHAALRDTLREVADENRALREQFSTMLAEQGKKSAAIRTAAAATLSTLPPVPASALEGVDSGLSEVLTIIKIKLDAGAELEPEEMAQAYRALTKMIISNAEVQAKLSAAQERGAVADGQVAALQAALADAKARAEAVEATNNELERKQLEELQKLAAAMSAQSTAGNAGMSAVQAAVAAQQERLESKTAAEIERLRTELDRTRAALDKETAARAAADKALADAAVQLSEARAAAASATAAAAAATATAERSAAAAALATATANALPANVTPSLSTAMMELRSGLSTLQSQASAIEQALAESNASAGSASASAGAAAASASATSAVAALLATHSKALAAAIMQVHKGANAVTQAASRAAVRTPEGRASRVGRDRPHDEEHDQEQEEEEEQQPQQRGERRSAYRGEDRDGSATPRRRIGPRTPAGKALIHRSESDGAPMPPEEWSAEIVEARSGLIEALEELALREDEVKKLEAVVREHADRSADMMAQQTALYRAYVTEKAALEARAAAAEAAAAEASARAEAAAVKAQRLDELTAVLEGGGDAAAISSADALTYVSTQAMEPSSDVAAVALRLRDYVRGLARKLAALEVAQPILARKYNLLKQEIATARAGQRNAEVNAVEAEAHMRHRILYLELWKKGAEARLSRLTEVSEAWVPGDEHAQVVAQLRDVQHRLTGLLASETQLRVQYTELRELPAKLAVAQAKVSSLTAELEASRAATVAAKHAAGEAQAALHNLAGTPEGSGVVVQTASRAELVAAVTRQRAELAEADVTSAGLSKKNAILAARIAELEGAVSALTQRVHAAEDALAEARSLATRGSSSSGGAGDGNGDCGTPTAEVAALKAKLQALTEERDALSREVHKARELADIAADQAAAVTGLAKDRELEVEELKESVRTLTARSDDDAIIGKLQHQLLTLKASYHTFLRKHESMRVALQRSHVACTALEVVVDQRAGETLAVREDARVKSLALQRVIDELRLSLRTLESNGITLAQAQQFNEAVRRLSGAVDRQAAELEATVHGRHAAEELAEARALQIASLQKSLDDLKLVAGSAGRGAGGSGESRDVVRRLIELHDALRGEQLSALRYRRELAVLRDDTRLARKRNEDYESHVRALEERIVSQDTELRRREDEYRRQLRAALAQAEAEAGHVAAVAAAEAGGSSASSSGADAGGGASDSAGVEARIGKLVAALEVAEQEGRRVRERAEGALSKARMYKRRVAFLESQLAVHGANVASLKAGYEAEADDLDDEDEDMGGSNGGGGGGNPPGPPPSAGGAGAARNAPAAPAANNGADIAKEHYQSETVRLQKAAQATIASLKSVIDEKNAVIADYQQRLELVRREAEAHRSTELREREHIAQAAYEENRATIERLRAAVKELQLAPASAAASVIQEQLLERNEALEQMLETAQRRVRELETSVATLQASLATAQQRASLAGATSEASHSAVHSEVAALQRRVAELQSGPVKEKEAALAASVDELKGQIVTRDRKLKTLQASLMALKDEFVRAEEEHAATVAQLQSQARAAAAGNAGAGAGAQRGIASGGIAARRGSNSAGGGGNGEGDGGAPGGGGGGLDAATQAKVASLLEMVGRMRKEVLALKERESEGDAERKRLADELARTRAELTRMQRAAMSDESTRLRAEASRLNRELEAVRSELRAKVTEAAEAAARAQAADATAAASQNHATSEEIALLLKRVRILEAQNAALKSAQAEPAAATEREDGPATPSAATLRRRSGAATGTPQPGDENDEAGASPTAGSGAATNAARAAWEAERKMRKKLESLQLKLNEKVKEAETARASEASASSALAKLKAEKDTLEKRLASLIKKQQSLDAATVAALAEIEPVAQLKARIFDLEEEVSALRERADGQLAGQIKALEVRVAEESRKAEVAAQEAREARERLAQLQKISTGATAGNGEGDDEGAARMSAAAKSLRRDEDRYLAEHSLRDKLGEARRAIAALESTILAKDATVLELRFEVEAAKQSADRLRKRVAEVTAFATIATRGKGLGEGAAAAASGLVLDPLAASRISGNRGSVNAGAPGSGGMSSKREGELEELVTALKRVTEKQKAEIERMRKAAATAAHAHAPNASAAAAATMAALTSSSSNNAVAATPTSKEGGAGAGAGAVTSAEAAEAVKALKAAKAEVTRLKERMLAMEQDAKTAENLRRALHVTEAELKAAKRALAAAQERDEAATARAGEMERKLRELGQAAAVPAPLPPAPAPAPAPAAAPTDAAASASASAAVTPAPTSAFSAPAPAAAAATAAVTPSGASAASRAATPAATSASPAPDTTITTAGGAGAGAGAVAGGSVEALRSRVASLEAENADLKRELSAFDIDFFEEIEDLKYKYAEAAKKCRAFDEYVKLYPPTGPMPNTITGPSPTAMLTNGAGGSAPASRGATPGAAADATGSSSGIR